jgi:hypothetical protein
MREFKYSISAAISLIAISIFFSSCRKKIDFNNEDKIETGTLGPYQKYYEPWTLVSVGVTGTPKMIASDGSYLYISSYTPTKSYVCYINGSHSFYPLFESQTYTFTAMEKGVSRMVLGSSGGVKGLTEFDENGVYFSFDFLVTSGRRVNDINDDGLRLYAAGDFVGTTQNPTSQNVDKHYKSTNSSEGMSGLIGEVYDLDVINSNRYASGKFILNTGHSIAMWDGSTWLPHTSIINEKVTDIQWYNDTLMIAGFANGEAAIRKFANGALIDDNEVINTSVSEQDCNIKMFTHGGRLYAYGTLNFQGGPFHSLMSYENGHWNYVGKMGGMPNDVEVFNGYFYAIVGSHIKRLAI